MGSGEKLFAWLLVLLLLIVTWSGNFVFLLNSERFHENEFSKIGANASVGMSVVDYVRGRAPLTERFNERESSHLADVRSLFSKIKAAYYASLALMIGAAVFLFIQGRSASILPDAFFRSGLISLALIALLFLASLSFGSFFAAIHKPFFAGDTWLFPADSLLIQTFPQEFFRDFTGALTRSIFLNSAVFLFGGIFVKRRLRAK